MEMTKNTYHFDSWIRHTFIQINTELETLYFAQSDDKMNTEGIGETLKKQLVKEGTLHISKLLKEGNTDQGFEAGYDLLGNVGFYMAACRRHGITNPDQPSKQRLEEASALALHLGASLRVTPRFSTAHLTTHNTAINGVSKSFTTLPDEAIFNRYNTRAILAYKRASDALNRLVFVGITNTLAVDLLNNALQALNDVICSNDVLYKSLDADRFFYSIRPYYKPHHVGPHIYRGANAGDFAGINVIDMLLGLCRADHAYYSQLLVDKVLYMPPEDQKLLTECMRRPSFLNQLLSLPSELHTSDTYQTVAKTFIAVCEKHGDTAKQHHDNLVAKFITSPSASIKDDHQTHLTASGPPLPVLLKSLEKLRDLRMAADRKDIRTRYHDLRRLRATLI